MKAWLRWARNFTFNLCAMKRITRTILLFSGLLFYCQISAQVQVTLTIPNLGSPYLSDYIGTESNRVMILTNATNQQQSIFLRGKIEQLSSPGYYFRTEESYKPASPILLRPYETRTFFAREPDWAFIESEQLEDNLPGPVKRQS